MNKYHSIPEFRFYYFTRKYDQTVRFYRDILQWKIMNQWDRGPLERGTIFISPNGSGLIEIEEGETEPQLQGGLYIEVENIDAVYNSLMKQGVSIIQPLENTSYGHRNFMFEDPNGLCIRLFCYLP